MKNKKVETGKVNVLMRASREWRTQLQNTCDSHGWSVQKGMEIVLGHWMNMEKLAQINSDKTKDAPTRKILTEINASLRRLELAGLRTSKQIR